MGCDGRISLKSIALNPTVYKSTLEPYRRSRRDASVPGFYAARVTGSLSTMLVPTPSIEATVTSPP